MVSLPLLEDQGWVIAAVGLILAVVVAVDVGANWRRRSSTFGIVTLSVAGGIWIGLLGRLVTARSSGANIGGSGMLMVSALIVPVVAIVLAAKVRSAAAADRRSGSRLPG